MNTYLPPSKSEVSELQIVRFNVLYQKIHSRLDPATAEEVSLCNEIVVGLWHHKTFRSRAQMLEKQLEQENLEPEAATSLGRDWKSASRQSKFQKDFAWRRRKKFFAMKTLRENLERLPKAAWPESAQICG